MKLPQIPPRVEDLLSSQRIPYLLQINYGATDKKGQYLHWDKLRHLQSPADLSKEEWWLAMKLARRAIYQKLPLFDKYNIPFLFAAPASLLQKLQQIDQEMDNFSKREIINSKIQYTYLTHAYMEEAITSSQLEGAFTTYQAAKEMLRRGRKPRDRSEQMIFNNYQAIQFIREIKDEALTLEIILELQRIVTENTLDNTQIPGKLRQANEKISVVNNYGEILHIPPLAEQLPERLKRLCDFANQATDTYLHPACKAIIIHFMLAYEHPFVDGNGRTARALFYWFMARHNYKLIEYLSISHIIKQAPIQYGRAYLYTETDENDLTYFIYHQLDTVIKAINHLHSYLEKKNKQLYQAKEQLHNIAIEFALNDRQLMLLKHAQQHPNTCYHIEPYRRTHKIAYDTARTDLIKLADAGLLTKQQRGKAFVFRLQKNFMMTAYLS